MHIYYLHPYIYILVHTNMYIHTYTHTNSQIFHYAHIYINSHIHRYHIHTHASNYTHHYWVNVFINTLFFNLKKMLIFRFIFIFKLCSTFFFNLSDCLCLVSTYSAHPTQIISTELGSNPALNGISFCSVWYPLKGQVPYKGPNHY